MRARTTTKNLAAIALIVGLGACSTARTPDPVGIGSGNDELKGSPCACTEIPMVIPENLQASAGFKSDAGAVNVG